MAANLVDLVKIKALSTGTGAITLGDAVAGYRGKEALTNGGVYSYAIQQGSEYEVGQGTYLGASNVFVRSPRFSSDGGTAINLSANAAVAFVLLSEDLATKVFDTTALDAEIARAAGAEAFLASRINSAASGMPSYATAADLPTDPTPAVGTQARVYADDTGTNNGVWIYKDGAWAFDQDYYDAVSSVVQPLVDEAAASAAAVADTIAPVDTVRFSIEQKHGFWIEQIDTDYSSRSGLLFPDPDAPVGLDPTNDAFYSIEYRHGFYFDRIASDFSRSGGSVLPVNGDASAILPWAGALTGTSFVVAADITSFGDGVTELEVSTDAGFIDRSYISPPSAPYRTAKDAATDYRTVKIAAAELRAGTTYHYRLRVDGVAGTAQSLKTPGLTGTVAFGSCNHQQYYSDFPAWHAIASMGADLFIHCGDLVYQDNNVDDVRIPRQENIRFIKNWAGVAALTAVTPIAYCFDNHDAVRPHKDQDTYPEGTDYAALVGDAARAYREIMPHYPLLDQDRFGLTQAWDMFDARFILLDTTTNRRANSAFGVAGDGVMLGADQIAAIKDQLDAALAAGLKQAVIISPERWDYWQRFFPSELATLATIVRNHALKVRFATGDIHYLVIDDGALMAGLTGVADLTTPSYWSSGLCTIDEFTSGMTASWNGSSGSYFDVRQVFMMLDFTGGGKMTARLYGEPYTGYTPTLLATCADDDVTPAIEFADDAMSAAAGSAAQVPIKRSWHGPSGGSAATWTSSDGQTGTAHIGPNEGAVTIPVIVPAAGSITLTLSAPTGGELGAQTTFTLSAA